MNIYIIFEYFKSKNLNESTCILNLRSNWHMLKQILTNIKTNAFNICIAHLWLANTNIQFILDPYVIATYCTSYMTKID
jgi:hypothetical protein